VTPADADFFHPFYGELTMSKHNILFICTGNSSRSIMAEAIMNYLGPNRFVAYSAGSQPAGQIKQGAIDCLTRNQLSTEGMRSKSWSEFSQPGAPVMDFVITVCDNAAGEVCPVWPGQPLTAHWGIEDPGRMGGSEAELAKSYWDSFMKLHRRISILLSLPMDKLDRLALQQELQKIGLS
jgi:arsenate reductase